MRLAKSFQLNWTHPKPKVKAEAKGMLAEEVEDALENVEIKPEVKMEEDFEEEESEGNNDEDYMVSIAI